MNLKAVLMNKYSSFTIKSSRAGARSLILLIRQRQRSVCGAVPRAWWGVAPRSRVRPGTYKF